MMVDGIIIAVIGAVVAVILGFAIQHFRKLLEDPESRKILGQRLLHRHYFESLEGGLDWLEEAFGPTMGIRPPRFGRKGFGVCLFLSLCYTIAPFIIGWMFGAPGALGDALIFKDISSLVESWPRQIRGAISLLIPIAAFLFVFWMTKKLWVRFVKLGGTGKQSLSSRGKIIMTAGMFIAIVGTATGMDYAAGAPTTVYAFFGSIAIALAVGRARRPRAVSVAAIGSASITVAVACTIIWAFYEPIEFLAMALFNVLLPLLNAIWDWCSLSLSRWLGTEALERKTAAVALRLAVVDILAAIGFLVSLAIALPFFVGLLERLSSLSLNVGGYLEIAAASPWTTGFWATFMLFSTFVPTATHAAVALFSVLPLAGRESWRKTLKAQIDSGKAVNFWWPTLYFSFCWVASIGLVGLAGWGLSWLLITGGVPVAPTLLKIAEWSLALSGALFP